MSFVNGQNKTISEETSIIVNGKEYIFNTCWIEKLKKVNTEVTEEYIKSLLNYLGVVDPTISPIYISHLLRYDYYNKVIFNSNGGTTICQCDYDGNITKEFTTLDELLEIPSTKGSLFTLKNKKSSGHVPKRCKVDFFGTEITPMFTEKSWRYSFISSLNLWMKDFVKCGDAEHRSKVYTESEFCEIARKHYSLDEYLIKSKMSFLFSLGGALQFGFSQRYRNKERKDTLSENEYNEQLNELLKRYTHNNTPLFQKVQNLNDFKSQIGIYILCLPEVKGFYVGKTIHSLKKRITSHWTNPMAFFT